MKKVVQMSVEEFANLVCDNSQKEVGEFVVKVDNSDNRWKCYEVLSIDSSQNILSAPMDISIVN